MILSITPSIITEPKFLDLEILGEEPTIEADARQAIMKVIEMSLLVGDEEPDDNAFAYVQTKLIAAGFLCTHFKMREPFKLRVMMTPSLESSFVTGPRSVIDLVDGRVKIDRELNDKVQKFIATRVPLQNPGRN